MPDVDGKHYADGTSVMVGVDGISVMTWGDSGSDPASVIHTPSQIRQLIAVLNQALAEFEGVQSMPDEPQPTTDDDVIEVPVPNPPPEVIRPKK